MPQPPSAHVPGRIGECVTLEKFFFLGRKKYYLTVLRRKVFGRLLLTPHRDVFLCFVCSRSSLFPLVALRVHSISICPPQGRIGECAHFYKNFTKVPKRYCLTVLGVNFFRERSRNPSKYSYSMVLRPSNPLRKRSEPI